MSFKVNFMANQNVTAEDLNNAGYNMTNTAYTTFTDDTLYGVNALNQITANIVSKGVKRGGGSECGVTLSNGIIHIADGTAFFDCGAVMKIDTDGIDIEPENSEDTQYIYLFFNEALNAAGARCTAEYPSGDFVLLGSAAGDVVTMDRTYASFRPDVKGTNEVKIVALECSVIGSGDSTIYRYKTDFNVTKYSKVYFHHCEEEPDSGHARGVFDIKNQILEFYVYSYYLKNSFEWEGYTYNKNTSIVKIEDGYLIIDIPRHYLNNNYTGPLYLELYGGAEE